MPCRHKKQNNLKIRDILSYFIMSILVANLFILYWRFKFVSLILQTDLLAFLAQLVRAVDC